MSRRSAGFAGLLPAAKWKRHERRIDTRAEEVRAHALVAPSAPTAFLHENTTNANRRDEHPRVLSASTENLSLRRRPTVHLTLSSAYTNASEGRRPCSKTQSQRRAVHPPAVLEPSTLVGRDRSCRCPNSPRLTELHLELAVEVGEYEFGVGAQVRLDQVIPWRDVPDAAGSRVPPAVARARQVTGLKSRARGYCSEGALDGAFSGGGVEGVSVLVKTYASAAVEGVIREYMARCELNERGIESHVSNALFCRAIRVSRNINGRPALARALSRLSGSRGLEASRLPEVRAVLATMM